MKILSSDGNIVLICEVINCNLRFFCTLMFSSVLASNSFRLLKRLNSTGNILDDTLCILGFWC